MATKKKNLLLPRGYISWTQLQLWERSKKEYERIYFYGGTVPKSRYMDFGSEVADDGENGTSEKETVKALNMLLPTYKIVEHKIDAEIKTQQGLIKVHGRLDTYEPTRFRERKTGTVPWTQRKVDGHGQVDFYYMLVFLATGKLPTEAWLDWAETKVNDEGGIELTGEHTEFMATRTMTDVLRMISRTKKAALEIAEHYNIKLMAL